MAEQNDPDQVLGDSSDDTGIQDTEGTPEPSTGDGSSLVIVGIGASAGGLAPLGEFFDHVPAGSGLAFVVIQHLSPHGQSLLPELLARHTTMEVRQAEEGVRVVENTVHIIPPGHDLVLCGGLLHLQERDGPGEVHLPIDLFFRSLAEDRGLACAGIILSGAGADGALGLRVIKEHGGLVIAQAPSTAEQASMPRHAIGTGVVDYVLPPAEMSDVLLNYAAHLQTEEPQPRVEGNAEANTLKTILAILRARTGHDFCFYKQSSILRGVQRRMLLCQIQELGEYARHLHRNPEESHTLLHELLITVTEFFRDPEAFEIVRERVLPNLLDGRAPDDPLRVWVPACATGEEAYSLAILIREYLDEKNQQAPVQIFATDIDDRAIEKARRGFYPHTIAAHVSAQRLDRYFVPADGDYQVVETVRKMVVFATQSIIKDAPFSHIDLVSCRNLMIYLEPDLQRAVLSMLAYALRTGGYLLLGTSETPVQSAPLYFETMDHKWRIYRRLEGRVALGAMPALPGGGRAPTGPPGEPATARQSMVHQAVERFLLENHLPPCLVVDREGQILFIYGRTGRYLEPVAGQAGAWHVVRLMRDGLRVPLATAIHRAASEGRAVRVPGVRFELEGHVEDADVSVTPFDQPAILKGLFLVVLEERRPLPAPAVTPQPKVAGPEGSRQREAELEKELHAAREYLQSTVEELQSANEEARSTNEELQSANEELKTAQEEAQSVNEELSTLNVELRTKLDELQVANDDMKNLLGGVNVGILFLDRHFRVRRFNRAVTGVINLMPGDVGRPVGHISSRLREKDWLPAAHLVFESLRPHQEEVESDDGQWYSMHIQPYRTTEDAIDGVVVTFGDITAQKKVEQALCYAQALAQQVVETVRQPLVVLDGDLRVKQANPAFYQTFDIKPEETEGRRLYDLGDREWDIPRLRELLETIIPEDSVLAGFTVDHEFESVGCRHLVLNARRLDARDGRPDLILLAIEEGQAEAEGQAHGA